MNDIIQQLKTNYKNGSFNTKLIFICVGVFVISFLIDLLFFRNSAATIFDYFDAKPNFEQFFSQPWGIFTYTFFHGGVLHLALNMLMIYFVGQLFLRYFRKEDFLTFFLFGSITGALFFMGFSYVFHYSNGLVGASAAVYAVFFALVAYIPKTKVQLMFININIPLDYVAYGLLALDVFMIVTDSNVGGHVSHIGGAAFGFLYMKQFEKGNDFLGGIIRSLFFREKKSVLQKERRSAARDDYEFNSQKVNKQKEVDTILDKISRSGYDSLTKEEKDFLFKQGKNG